MVKREPDLVDGNRWTSTNPEEADLEKFHLQGIKLFARKSRKIPLARNIITCRVRVNIYLQEMQLLARK
jgi:hypothetical protein